MVREVRWDTPRGDGTPPFSLTSRTTRSNLDRLFYIKGALTMFTVLVATFVLPDFPSTSHRWLSPVEVDWLRSEWKRTLVLAMKVRSKARAEGKCSDGLEVINMALKYVILRTPRERI
jgi:hypothetical protein